MSVSKLYVFQMSKLNLKIVGVAFLLIFAITGIALWVITIPTDSVKIAESQSSAGLGSVVVDSTCFTECEMYLYARDSAVGNQSQKIGRVYGENIPSYKVFWSQDGTMVLALKSSKGSWQSATTDFGYNFVNHQKLNEAEINVLLRNSQIKLKEINLSSQNFRKMRRWESW